MGRLRKSNRNRANGGHALISAMMASAFMLLAASSVHGDDLESRPEGEDEAIATIVSLALGELEKRYPAGSAIVRRDAHAKAHGCAKAVFRVDPDIAAELRVGLFSEPGREFKAWTRFSNGAFEPAADTARDGRGLALKILDVRPGEPASESAAMLDVLMINHPVFFSPDALDYRDFATAGALTGATDKLRKYFMPSLLYPPGWRASQALIAYRIANAPVTSPLTTRYFSMLPFLFGENRAVKYAARPCPNSPVVSPAKSDTEGPDFLRTAMKDHLDQRPACFELSVQQRGAGMPVEDATVEWSETKAPFQRVGVVEIPQQSFATAERDAFCEQAQFNPWNAPPSHRPLGGMNRVRKAVYEAISRYRHTRNGKPAVNPDEAWDRN